MFFNIRQGIPAALQVEKTSGTKNRGRIITEKEMPPPLPLQATIKPEQTIAEIMKNPSKVICLRVCSQNYLYFFFVSLNCTLKAKCIC